MFLTDVCSVESLFSADILHHLLNMQVYHAVIWSFTETRAAIYGNIELSQSVRI